jgi:predicted dienelactone hydrolase
VTWRIQSGLRRRRDGIVVRARLALAATLAAGFVLAPPVGAVIGHSQPSTPAPRYGVGIARCTFVDHSRGVLNYSSTPYRVSSSSRTLVTEVRYPAQYLAGGPGETVGVAPVARSGGYPTVFFAHGYDVTPDTYAALLDAWVRAGFVVVAPSFPDESPSAVAAQHGTNTERDLVNEPGDLAFVTNAVLAASANETSICPVAFGLIDPSEIALAGHSDGADAVGMLAYDHGDDPQGVNYASLRTGLAYRAVIILSGAEDTYQSNATEASRPNLLVVQSRADQCNPWRDAVQLYRVIHQSNKWFLALLTAHHLPPFDDRDAAAFDVVSATTVRFLQISLEGVSPPTSLLALGNQRPAVARMYVGAHGPSTDDVVHVSESCGPN